MDKYKKFKEQIIEYAKSSNKIKTVIAIGSSTRKTTKADEFSDLDIMIATTDTQEWIAGDVPEKFGSVHISFVEPTLGGGKERRVYYDDFCDVDMLIYTPEQFTDCINKGEASWVMNRGYEVLYDVADFTKLLEDKIDRSVHAPEISEDDFINMVNNFFFHIIWAGKKVLRGEIWSAKMCVDAYLKQFLLKIMELYCSQKYTVDTWHDGRFIDSWADESIKAELKNCFAHYEKGDIKLALKATEKLFARLAFEISRMKNYSYPNNAQLYAESFLEEFLK